MTTSWPGSTWCGPKAGTIALAAAQLLAIGAQRRVWERRMGVLLLGGPSTGAGTSAKEGERGQAVPGGEIYLSFACRAG